MIDIHSHILWGVDDGVKTFEDSARMLRISAESGTTDIVATPHSNSRYTFEPVLIEARIEELRQVSGLPHIHRGCDFNLSYENIQDGLISPEKYTLNHLNYLLVEFPDLNISPAIDKVFVQFLDRDIVPIITHPERNGLLQQRIPKLTAWVKEGCLLQVTALSITGGFGKEARDCAWDLLQRGLVHVVASDAHDPEHRHTRLNEAREAVAKRFGEENANLLFEINPRAAIEGRDPTHIQAMAVEPKRKWFSFLR